MNQLIIIRGYPGSGKTTLGKSLEKLGYGRFIDHNTILDFISKITGDDKGIYEDINNLEIAIARKLISEERSIIIARGFSKNSSMNPYLQLIAGKEYTAHIFNLDCSIENLNIRVLDENRAKQNNPTTSKDSLLKWVSLNPIEICANEIIIDANQNAIDVLSSVETYLYVK